MFRSFGKDKTTPPPSGHVSKAVGRVIAERGAEADSADGDYAPEMCWVAAGRLVVAYDEGVFPGRSAVEITADGREAFRLTGEGQPLGLRLLRNGDFADGTLGWELLESPSADLGVDLAPEWTLAGSHTGYVRDLDAASLEAHLQYVGAGDERLIPVMPGLQYELSALLGTHRCTAEVTLEFLDEALQVVGQVTRPVHSGRPGGQDARTYEHVSVRCTAPDRAAWARLVLHKSATIGGAADSYLFIAKVGFSRSGSEAFDPSLLQDAYAAAALWQSPSILSLPLPARLADGLPHEIALIDPESGRQILGSPLQLQPVPAYDGGVEQVSGSLLLGWARDQQDPASPAQVAIEVDGTEIARATADEDHAAGVHGFRAVIPSRLLDGRGHHVVLRALPGGFAIQESVRLFPHILTPWDALQQHASDPLPTSLAPAAAYRYRSMQLDLEAPALDGESRAVRLPQLGIAHGNLVRGYKRKGELPPLAFPVHEEPLVSVVIPVHGKHAVTYNCLSALLFAFSGASFEVIVVDDASTDETRTLEELVAGITVIHNEQNLGFGLSCNAGADVARGKYIAFLNNDTEPTASWLDEALLVFRNFADVGMVGSKLLYPDGRLQEAGGIVWADGEPWNYGRDHNPHMPQFNYTRQADYVSGAALVIDSALWQEVGGFSEEFAPAYFEDTDLAFKVRAAGRKVVYAPFSVVFHYEGVSNGTDTGSGLKRFQEIHRPIFKAKWAKAFADQPTPGTDPRLAADGRAGQKRALFVDHSMPQPERSAGGYAAIQEMRLIQSLGYQVAFFPENLAWLGADTEHLQRMGIEVVSAPFYFSLQALLEDRGPEFDLVYLTRFDTAVRAVEPIRQFAPRAKVALQLADLHFLRQLRDAVSGSGSMEVVMGTREEELRAIREVDVTLSYSEIELAVIESHNLAQGHVARAPWVMDVPDIVPPTSEREGVAFLGSYNHPPNRQAIEFFCREVMPLVREQRPGTVLHVYGAGWPHEFRDNLAADDVVFEGFVKRVADAYDTCRVAVAPLVSGAGLKGKVMEALSHGVPQVLSPVAVEGTGLRHGLEVLVAESAQDWAGHVVSLCQDDEIWQALSQTSQQYARTTYSFERGQELMRKALEMAGEFAAPTPQALFIKNARPDWTR